MGFGSIWHWLVVLLIVLLIFGAKRLRNIGSDLGAAVKGFRDSMKEGEAAEGQQPPEQPGQVSQQGAQPPQPRVIEGEATREHDPKPKA